MEQQIAQITFTQAQVIAICGAVVGSMFLVGMLKKLLDIFKPQILTNKAFVAFLPDLSMFMCTIFLLAYKLYPDWQTNVSVSIVIGYFSAAIFKSIKSKFGDSSGEPEKTT